MNIPVFTTAQLRDYCKAKTPSENDLDLPFVLFFTIKEDPKFICVGWSTIRLMSRLIEQSQIQVKY